MLHTSMGIAAGPSHRALGLVKYYLKDGKIWLIIINYCRLFSAVKILQPVHQHGYLPTLASIFFRYSIVMAYLVFPQMLDALHNMHEMNKI